MTRIRFQAACLAWLALAGFCGAQTQARGTPEGSPLGHVLELARSHRYAEAETAMRGLHPPQDPRQRITFFRLRASIESGLGHSKAAAADMELAANLAPDDAQLQAAAALSRLEMQLETQADPTVTLKVLRGVQLPVEKMLEVRLRTAEVLSRAHRYSEAAEDFADASRMAPNRVDIFFNLALARYYNGQWDGALESAERAKTFRGQRGH